ncbi:MAG: hypothetical protein ACHQDY_09120 [Solirubrobacterales bacterium]
MPSLRHALALLSAVAWLQPPAVLPLPSRSGPDGPPRPYGVEPPPGAPPGHTAGSLALAQDHALLDGPFPRGGLVRGVSDGALLLSEHAEVRGRAVAMIAAAGARVVRIPVNWRDVVDASPPAGFQASDPASPAYHFWRIDAAVESALGAGLEPLLVVSHAPAFAEAPNRWPYAYPGSWAPNPAALGAFAAALARRYDGSFPDPLAPGGALGRVRLLQAWNEPNLSRYLEPQWVVEHGRWSAFSPLLYRQLLDGFYAGVKSVEPTDTVIAAGVAPEGEPAGQGVMSPVPFLRGLLCLESSGRCQQPPRFDVLAFHPLSVWNPDVLAASALDVSIADMAKVTDVLHQAERLHTALPAGPKPVWVTELNWESAPQSPHGVPPRLQATWLSRALHRLWVAGVSLVDWEFLVDPVGGVALASPTGPTVTFARPAGLYSAGVTDGRSDPALARPKPFLGGFAFPFDPLRVDRRRVRVWALLARPGQLVQLQRRTRGGMWRTVASLHADRYGVLNALVPLRGSASLRLLSAALVSAPESVARGRSLQPVSPTPRRGPSRRASRRRRARGSSRARPVP